MEQVIKQVPVVISCQAKVNSQEVEAGTLLEHIRLVEIFKQEDQDQDLTEKAPPQVTSQLINLEEQVQDQQQVEITTHQQQAETINQDIGHPLTQVRQHTVDSQGKYQVNQDRHHTQDRHHILGKQVEHQDRQVDKQDKQGNQDIVLKDINRPMVHINQNQKTNDLSN